MHSKSSQAFCTLGWISKYMSANTAGGKEHHQSCGLTDSPSGAPVIMASGNFGANPEHEVDVVDPGAADFLGLAAIR